MSDTNFSDLSPEGQANYRRWAREHYAHFSPVQPFWHEVVQDECRAINAETHAALEATDE